MLRHDGVSLFRDSYDERFLGDLFFDPLMELLDARWTPWRSCIRLHSLEPEPGAAVARLHDGVSPYTTRAANFSGALERFGASVFICCMPAA